MISSNFITNSFEETQKAGEAFARSVSLQGLTLQKKAMVIALYGDLGSGKTTFVQGLAKGLGIKRRLISPTFNIVRMYKITIRKEARTINFYHIDLYRIELEKYLEGLGIEEIINDSQNIVAIEWAERLGSLLPQERIDIRFEHLEEDKRGITITDY